MTVRVEYSHILDAPVADAWAVVGDFGSLLSWVRGGSEGSISLTGEGPGMLRNLVLPSVGEVQHRLEVLDEDAHRVTYSLTSGKPLGMVEYSVSVRLLADPAEPSRCAMYWTGEFTADPGAVPDDMAKALRNAYQDMSERLGEFLAQPDEQTQRTD